MTERKTVVVKLTNAEFWPHSESDRYQHEWEKVRGREIRVYLPAEENAGGHCDGVAPIWRVHEEDLANLSPRLATDFKRDKTRVPGLGYFVCRHQLQEPPE